MRQQTVFQAENGRQTTRLAFSGGSERAARLLVAARLGDDFDLDGGAFIEFGDDLGRAFKHSRLTVGELEERNAAGLRRQSRHRPRPQHAQARIVLVAFAVEMRLALIMDRTARQSEPALVMQGDHLYPAPSSRQRVS